MMRTTMVSTFFTTAEFAFKARISAESKEDVNTIDKIIIAAEVDFILQLAMKDKDIDAICRQSRFDPHWQNAWRKMGVNPSEFYGANADAFHENLPMKTVSCLDLLKGDQIYRKYRLVVDNNSEMKAEIYLLAKSYLEEAAAYGCYFALNALCTNGLKQMKELLTPVARQAMAGKILMYAHKAADLHWTPGYWLLASVLQELCLYDKEIYPDAPKWMRKKTFFTDAAIALYIAQKLERYSADSINNAYQGKTIWQATSGVFSSWLHAKTYLQKMSGELLTLKDLDAASLQASIVLKDMDKTYHFDASELLSKTDKIESVPEKIGRQSPTSY